MIRAIFISTIVLFFGCSSDSSLPYELRLTPSGLGAIKIDTPLDKIPSTLVGFETNKLYPISPQIDEIIFELTRADAKIAHIIYDTNREKISQIHILSKEILTSKNDAISQTISDDAICEANICYYSDEPSIFLEILDNKEIAQIYYKEP